MNAGSISAPQIIPLRTEQSQKYLIDTNTLIEIRSDTHDTDIYYTLDGSKPDGFITLTTRRSTIEYIKPFYIPRELTSGGKITIKAIVVSRNGIRESAVATKVFDIKHVPSDHVQSDEYENRYISELQQERKELMRKLHSEHQHVQQKPSDSMYRSLTDSFSQENPSRYTYSAAQKQTNALRCAHCFAPKTNDLYTRFCTECGLPWQKLTGHSPPDKSAINVCANCQSTIPFNSHTCVVCEAQKSSEYQRRASVQNQTKILCPKCKSANPIHLRTCYMCESVLMPTSTPQIRASVSVPTPPETTNIMMTCSSCFRLNNVDARFCDWCGAQPERLPMPIKCTKCRADNGPHAKFCSTCGCVIEPPLRVTDTRLRNDSSIPASSMIASTLTRNSASPTWLNASATVSYHRQPHLTTKTEAATQTYGIYYPSAKDLDLLITQNKKLQAEQEFPERAPLLTSASPGKGYWRRQLDHVCAHLKAYAVNRPDFRSLIGEPRMGKMVHATVHETDHQVTVQAVFLKPEDLSRSSFYIDETNGRYRKNTERSLAFSSTFNSDEEYTAEKSERTKARKRGKQRPHSAATAGTDTPNHALLKLLGKESKGGTKKSFHHGDISDEVRRLLREEKADANCRDKDDYTALQLAVRNKHNDCLEALIEDGKARLDKKGPHGTTALHECCLLGLDGIEPLRILLRHGGNVSWSNDRNESVTDIASKQNCPELLQVIASSRGQQMINQQTKSYYDDHARTKTANGRRSSEKS